MKPFQPKRKDGDETMFQKGDTIIYENSGVCEVECIGPLDFSENSKNRLYYTLRPLYSKGSTVFTPVDNAKVLMRPVLTRSEVMELIEEIPDIDSLWITNEKERESMYKKSLRTCDCRELIRIIKTVYLRKQSRIEAGKKLTNIDDRYFRTAEEKLYGELAVPLHMTIEETKEFVIKKVHETHSS